MLKDYLQKVLDDNTAKSKLYKRNLLKEYLQVYVLDFIYSSKDYNELVFYGGSCLSQCYDLPRLSEDLDFVDVHDRIDLRKLAKDIEKYFNTKTDLSLEVKVQKFRLYLKFPILKELGLAKGERESEYLYLKIEIFKEFNFCHGYKTEIKPLFKANRSLFVKTFDLSTMMSTKIRAVLYRKWEKTDKAGKTLLSVKGRDYFDLMWYLEKDIKPNYDCIEAGKNREDIINDLARIINNADERSIKLDLENFIDDAGYLKNLENNIKQILISKISDM